VSKLAQEVDRLTHGLRQRMAAARRPGRRMEELDVEPEAGPGTDATQQQEEEQVAKAKAKRAAKPRAAKTPKSQKAPREAKPKAAKAMQMGLNTAISQSVVLEALNYALNNGVFADDAREAEAKDVVARLRRRGAK
jgi:hypothetical protein